MVPRRDAFAISNKGWCALWEADPADPVHTKAATTSAPPPREQSSSLTSREASMRPRGSGLDLPPTAARNPVPKPPQVQALAWLSPGQGESQGAWGPIPQEAELLPNRTLKLLPRHAPREMETSDGMARVPFLFQDPTMSILKKRSFSVKQTRFKSKLLPLLALQHGANSASFLGLFSHL